MRLRPSRDEMFMNIAKQVSERSTCYRIQVGCVLVRDDRIISIGYNGASPGSEHCDKWWDDFYAKLVEDLEFKNKFPTLEDFITSKEFFEEHHIWGETHEIHAEQNVIAYAAKNGISTKDSTLYVTYSPCIHCSKLISQAGIKEVKYLLEYNRDLEGIKFLENCGISCIKIK